MKIRATLLGILIVLPVVSSAQSDTLHISSMQEVYQQNSWLSGSNPVGLLFNRFNSVSVAEAGYSYSKGNLGKLSLPVSNNGYSVWSESFQTLGKVALYGRLGYVQNKSKGQNWNGMTNDYWRAVNLCDSVSGKLSGETYNLVGAFSIPLNERWSIGAQADYQVQATAKDADPRNKNQWSEWKLTPGLGFHSGKYIWGLSLLYADRKEDIDYQNMGTHAVYSSFAAYPLSFFKTLSRDGMVKWDYSGHEVGGALQFGFDKRGLRLFQQFQGSISKQDIESNRIQNCKEGESNLWQINYLGKLEKRSSHYWHEWSLAISYGQADNYEPLQQQAENEIWVSYGKVLRSTRNLGLCELTYEYRRMYDEWHPRFSLLSGISFHYQENALLFYPIKYLQPISRFTIHTTFGRSFLLQNAYLDCSLGGKYGIGGGSIMKEQKMVSNQSMEEVKLWQSAARLQQDYDYETSSRLSLYLTAAYTCKVPFCWFIRLSGEYQYSNKCRINENNKNIITSIGLVF